MGAPFRVVSGSKTFDFDTLADAESEAGRQPKAEVWALGPDGYYTDPESAQRKRGFSGVTSVPHYLVQWLDPTHDFVAACLDEAVL